MNDKAVKFFKSEKERRDGLRALYALALGVFMATVLTYWLDLDTTEFFICAAVGAASAYSAILKNQAEQTIIDSQDSKKDL